MSDAKKTNIFAKMVTYNQTLKNLLRQIQEIEDDKFGSVTARKSKLKKIKEEITKVGTEIDIARKELTLTDYNIN